MLIILFFGLLIKIFAKSLNCVLRQEFEMSMMGELNYFLGLQIKQMSDEIFVKQAEYTKELIKKLSLEYVKVSKTPMTTITKPDKDEKSKSVHIKLYCSIIGTLLYLTISGPDIMFSICVCAIF